MKKVYQYLIPLFPIIFGTLLLLIYVDGLTNGGGALAISLIGVIIAAFYIAAGIVPLCLGNKLNRSLVMVLEIGKVLGFPAFLFVMNLLNLIDNAGNLLISGWIIEIASLAAILGFITLYCITLAIKNRTLYRAAQILGLLLLLVFVLDLVFNANGFARNIGGLSLAELGLDISYAAILIPTLVRIGEEGERIPTQEVNFENQENAPSKEPAPEQPQEEPAEEIKEEPAPEEPSPEEPKGE